jgi:PAS domain S-box-containing protein
LIVINHSCIQALAAETTNPLVIAVPDELTREELEKRVESLQAGYEALESENMKYRQLVENLNDILYTLDRSAKITYISPNVERIAGYSPEELIGRNYRGLIGPDDMKSLGKTFERALAGEEAVTEHQYVTKDRGPVWASSRVEMIPALESFGKSINGQIAQFEMRVRKKDGSFGWYSFLNRPLYDSNARITGVTGIARNIDDRKSVEQALRESEQQKNLILNATHEMITYYDTDLRIIWTNHAAAKSVSSLPEELIGKHCYQIWQQRGEPCPQCPVLRTKETGKPEQLEKQTPDGRHWIIRGYPVMDEQERVTAFVEFTQEVTPHREAEAALRESEERFSIAFKSSPAPLVISEIDTGLFLNVNDRWVEMLEFSREELIGRRSKDVGIWDEPTERDRIVKKLHTHGWFRDEPIIFRTKSERTIMALWSAEAINISGKEVMLSMITDITELKHAEKERERLREQLSQAQKMESIGRLAGGVAHDLNNLLSPILGYGEMLFEDAAPYDPLRKPVEEIVNAGKRAQALVRQLLAFSRKQPLQFRALDVNMLLKDFEKLLRRTLREDIRIRMKMDKTIPQVKGDGGQLEQVVMNLSVNAQDAMPEGGVLVIETSHLELDEAYAKQKKGVKTGYYVMIAISDTGTGMGTETLERMFEPFYTTKDTGKGTGLGMSTAYGIIKQHGGNIWAYSEPGLGTTVKVYLPVLMESVDMAEPTGCTTAVTKGEETILLVEDDYQVRDLSKAVLRRYGYNVLVAGSGEEALQILAGRKEDIHLLLTDVVMPDINGKSLFEKVSASRPDIRVLYMSGYTDDVIVHHGVIDPDVAFIEKPFSIEGLAAKVREVLDK